MTWEDRLEHWRAELELFEQLEGWLPLADASERTGVSRSALRNWYRTGQIRSRLADGPYGPQRLVHVDEVRARADRSPRIQHKVDREVGLEAQVVLMRHRLDQLELRLAALERRPAEP